MAKSFLNTPNSTNLARGIRNNNPGNLVRTNIAWDGKIPHSQSTDNKFEQFIDLKHGIRAMMRDIVNDIKGGNKTVTAFINEYAPPNENNTTAYINSVLKALGIGAAAFLDLSEETVVVLSKIIARVENGTDASLITNADYADALAILGLDEPLKKKALTTHC